MRCWGDNERGQLGDGTRLKRKGPSVVVGLAEGASVLALGIGTDQTCAVLSGGAVYCWGAEYGGNAGTRGEKRRAPLSVPAVRVQPSGELTCAIAAADGRVWCWKSGDPGAAWQEKRLPAFVEFFAAPSSGICGIQANGEALCWDQLRPAAADIRPIKALRTKALLGGTERPMVCYDEQCWLSDPKGQVFSKVLKDGKNLCGLHKQLIWCGQMSWDDNDAPVLMAPRSAAAVLAMGPQLCGVDATKNSAIQCLSPYPTQLAWEPLVRQKQQQAAERKELKDLRGQADVDPAAAFAYLARFETLDQSFRVGLMYAEMHRVNEANKHFGDGFGWGPVVERSLARGDCGTAAVAAVAAGRSKSFQKRMVDRLIDTCGSTIEACVYAKLAASIRSQHKRFAVMNATAVALALNAAGQRDEALAAMRVDIDGRVPDSASNIDRPLDLAEVYVRLGSDKDVRELVGAVRKSRFHGANGTSLQEAIKMDVSSTLGRTIRMAQLVVTSDKRTANELWRSAARQVGKLPKDAIVAGQLFLGLEAAKSGKHPLAAKFLGKARKRLPSDEKRWPRWLPSRLARGAALLGDKKEAMRLLKVYGSRRGFGPVIHFLGATKDGRALLDSSSPQELDPTWLATVAADAGECALALKTLHRMGPQNAEAALVRHLTGKCPTLMANTFVLGEGDPRLKVPVLTYLGRFIDALDAMDVLRYSRSDWMAELAVEWNRRGAVTSKGFKKALASFLEGFDER